MTVYEPTAADYAFQLEHAPGSFRDEGAARTVLRQLNGGSSDGHNEHRLNALANNYVGAPMTSSPIPAEPDADGDGELDPEFAAICVECQPNQPCCMKSGKVADGADASRKIEWPPVDDQTKMLTVAKDMEGNNLVSKLDVSWGGSQCQVGHPERPHIATTGLVERLSRITEKSASVSVGYPQMPNMVLMLRKYVPEQVIYALLAFDMVMAMQTTRSGVSVASFTPRQCLTDGPMGAALTVIPLPYVKLDGKVEMATRIMFTTGGVSGSAEAKGSLTGQYGSMEIVAKGKAGGRSSSGNAVNREQKPPGLLGSLADVIGTMDRYCASGNTQPPRPLDLTEYASGVTLSKSLTFEPVGFELVGKSGSPDLELKIGTMTSTLAIGISGRLDFIDALAMAFSGPGAAAIREARARMASGKAVNARLDAYLEVGAEGTLTHTIDSGATVTIPANGDAAAAFAGLSQTFGGEMKIRGEASIGIRVEAKVWVFSAKAGASGTVHTSWTWEMRLQEGKRQKRYVFEGVVVGFTAYAEAGIASNDGPFSQDIINLGGEFAPEGNAADLYQQVADGISRSRSDADRISQAGNAQPAGGETYVTIFHPETTEWADY
ncbi:hypothetical protein OS190_18650 [Sulfitobacter sp. F26204]|uniref:hypothetical protein n=1 Tax=Sulfitobacter sp. F26204 TaxID=2996014 RepID=UPI00225DD8DC|nr:hypothetical protein [Sulfitobacter sp. F26204]MCX7561586.1 hypothetical protein [Sulfitobacter sp. F26204]